MNGRATGIDARVETVLERHWKPLLALVVLAALAGAWTCRFVQDDAFISFTYARNLVQGAGPTWFGARVEGYTNPLWVLWIAAGLALGAEPIAWSWLGSLLAFAAALVAVFRLGRALTGRALPAFLAGLAFASNYSVLAYGTGGLETMLQTALLAWAAVLAERLSRTGEHAAQVGAGFSLLSALAVLARPDSALPAMILAGWAGAGFVRRRAPARAWLALVLPGALVLGAWLAWKLSYYGRLLPNTYYAKSGVDRVLLVNGVRFVARFFHWYALWPLFVAGAAALALRHDRRDLRLVPLALIVGSWLAYVVRVGGDFMEFRFLVPIAPAVFVVLAWLVCERIAPLVAGPRAVVAAGALAVLVLASAHHARSFVHGTPDSALDSVPELATFYGLYPEHDWASVGEALRQQLAGTDPLLALQPVGAIPYYSGFRTVDQLGLTDPEVALHGLRPPGEHPRPGHQRRASLAYLRQRGVNLVIGHPILVPLDMFGPSRPMAMQGGFAGRWIAGTLDFETTPVPEALLVLVPVRPGVGLVAWYLTRTRALDARIVGRRWPVRDFVLPPAGAGGG